MVKRIFIVGSPHFPRGSAGANYDQYIALSLMEKGWKVIILGKGINRSEDFQYGKYIYKGIEYYNEPESNVVKYGIGLSFYKKMVNKYHISSQDHFILRDIGWLPQKWMAQRFGIDNMTYVHFEDLRPEQFKFHLINPQYWCFLLKWSFKLKKIKKALPISETLEKIEQCYGCRTLRIPIMADPDEFGESMKTKKPSRLRFVYPGAKLNGCEDDIVLMLHAFSMLTAEEKDKVELHITGTSTERLKMVINDRNLIDGLSGVLFMHGSLPYSDLIELYREMDFLVLVRFNNPLTIANFPSKIPETLCFGIIPLCSRVGDYTSYYLQNGKDSIIFDVGKVESCVAAIRKTFSLTDEDYLSMRSQARHTAVTKFGYKNWASILDKFILS